MHPRWAFGETLPGFLEPLRAVGLRALEFGLWDYDPDWPRFLPLMKDCRRMGFELCFHAPYLAPYTIAGFAGEKRETVQADYAPLLDIAARFAPAPVVIHGAWSETRPHDVLYADTIAFLEWVLGRYPSLALALENLAPDPRRGKIGTTRTEARRIVEKIDDHRLGLCWDMGHDVKAGRLTTPNVSWLRRVVHVHLHDIDENETDHYPLLHGRVPYRAWLPALVQAGFKGIVTLEIKGGQLAHLEFEQVERVLAASIAETTRLLTPPDRPESARQSAEKVAK